MLCSLVEEKIILLHFADIASDLLSSSKAADLDVSVCCCSVRTEEAGVATTAVNWQFSVSHTHTHARNYLSHTLPR